MLYRRGLVKSILSVRLSVKRVICDKMEERSVQVPGFYTVRSII